MKKWISRAWHSITGGTTVFVLYALTDSLLVFLGGIVVFGVIEGFFE
jgi:hypothetical protein